MGKGRDRKKHGHGGRRSRPASAWKEKVESRGKTLAKTKVFVAPISGGGMVHSTLMLLANFLPIWSADPKCPFAFAMSPELGTSPQEFARNRVIARFLESPCDVLLMIDDDMIVSGTVVDLLATPGDWDIVGPLMYMFVPPDPSKGREFPECYPCAFTFDREAELGKQLRPCYPRKGGTVSYVEAVGSGCVAIRRRVLEDERMRLDRCAPCTRRDAGLELREDCVCADVRLDPPAFYRNRYRDNGERIRGLDIDFCWRATDLGYKTMVNWAVQVGHWKKANLNDVDAYAKGTWALGYSVGAKSNVEREEGNASEAVIPTEEVAQLRLAEGSRRSLEEAGRESPAGLDDGEVARLGMDHDGDSGGGPRDREGGGDEGPESSALAPVDAVGG